MAFAWSKNEKIRRSRIVREAMSQYQRMQRDDMRELFPDWLTMEADALDRAKVTLDQMIAEHEREVSRRARQIHEAARRDA